MSFHAKVEKGTQITINNVACVADSDFKAELLDASSFDQAAELCNIAKLGTDHLEHTEEIDGRAVNVTYGANAERVEAVVGKVAPINADTVSADKPKRATKAKPKGKGK